MEAASDCGDVTRGDNVTRARLCLSITSVPARNRAALVALIGCCAVGLTACSDGGTGDNAKSSATPTAANSSDSPSPSPSSSEAAEKAAALDAYSRMWDEQVKAYAQTDIKGTELKTYATKDALARAMGDLLVMKRAGTATKGAPTHDAKVMSLTLGVKIPKATISDCLDISKWPTVKKKTGAIQPFPTNQATRYVTTANAEKWGNRWMITKLTPDGARTC
ncbi:MULTISPECIES: hypothetical protein [Streptomyces]|uniref:hypothetical protein n=1 Tax=Streptomyces TaxID=1883 RepID=UPI001F078711|nr:hypothetical protein [Streptomyces sp. S1D4-23]